LPPTLFTVFFCTTHAYRKHTILYGPNGLGKTSFFDAIDYVCTGRIGRLCRRRIDQKSFISLARNLDMGPGSGLVEMEVTRESSVFHLARTVEDWRYTRVGKESYDRANLLQFITSAQWGTRKPRVENIERLFRATHLFNQTDPELFTDFFEESILSSELVSRMLALDDYTSAITKATQVEKLSAKKLVEMKDQLNALADEIKEAKSRIKDLPKPSVEEHDETQIKKMAEKLFVDFQSKTNLNIERTDVSADSVRECRAFAEASLKEQRDYLNHIKLLEISFANYEKTRDILKSKTTQLNGLLQTLDEKKVAQQKLDIKKNAAEIQLENFNKKLSTAKTKMRHLEQMRELKDRDAIVKVSLEQWRQELIKSEKTYSSATKELQDLSSNINGLQSSLYNENEKIKMQEKKVEGLLEIVDGFDNWQHGKNRVMELKQNIASEQNRLKALAIQQKKAKEMIASMEAALVEKQHEHRKLTEEQTTLTSLLDQIETHVVNGKCPTCGFNHGEKEILLQKIWIQKEARPPHVEKVVKELQELTKAQLTSKSSLELSARQQEEADSNLKNLKKRLLQTEKFLTEYEKKIEEYGLNIMDSNLVATTQLLISESKAKLDASQKTVVNLSKEENQSIRKRDQVEKECEDLKKSIENASVEKEILEKQIEKHLRKAQELGWELDIPSKDLEKQFKVLEGDIKEVLRKIKEYKPAIAVLEKPIDDIQKQVKEIKYGIETLRKEKSASENEIDGFQKSLFEVTGSKDADIGHLKQKFIHTEERIRGLENLVRRAIFLERAFDSAARSAILSELEILIEKKSAQKKDISLQIQHIKSVEKWFAKIGDILNQQSSQAVENHVAAFGPLTTVIQKRLRPVYGFGDLGLTARGNAIRVAVNWADNVVRPTDYFSESQKQILMLSLFLGGRLTQNWSGFAPILLDDPVTHFDDLNAFSFVELIRGLVSMTPGKRQFIISTCEDRLFDLMKAKFSSIDSSAIFYRFDGIDADGPIVRKI